MILIAAQAVNTWDTLTFTSKISLPTLLIVRFKCFQSLCVAPVRDSRRSNVVRWL